MDDRVQAQWATTELMTVLEDLAAFIQEHRFTSPIKYHSQAGVTITFEINKSEEDNG